MLCRKETSSVHVALTFAQYDYYLVSNRIEIGHVKIVDNSLVVMLATHQSVPLRIIGMGTIDEFEVDDMPVTVVIDSRGVSVHNTGPKKWTEVIELILLERT